MTYLLDSYLSYDQFPYRCGCKTAEEQGISCTGVGLLTNFYFSPEVFRNVSSSLSFPRSRNAEYLRARSQ